jgi:hypothetical protein
MMLRRVLSICDLDGKNSCCDGGKFRRKKSNNNSHLRYLYACFATISFIPIAQKSNLFVSPKIIVSASSASIPPPLAKVATTRLNKRRPVLQFPFFPHQQLFKGDKISCIQRPERSVHKGRITAGTITNNRDTNNNIKNTSRTKKKKEQQRETHKKNHDNSWINSGFYYGIGENFLNRPLHKKNNTTYYKSSEPKGKNQNENEELKGGEVNTDYRSRSSEKKKMKKNLTTYNLDPTKVHTDSTSSYNSHDIHASNDESYYEVPRERQQSPETFATILRDAVQEFRKATDGIRDDLTSLKYEIMELQKLYRRNMYLAPQQEEEEQQYYNYDDYDEEGDEYSSSDHPSSVASREKRRRAAMFDQIAIQIENWAKKLIREEGKEEFGWKVVECNKLLRGKYNPDGQTKVYVKWMTDPRDDDPSAKQKQTEQQQQVVADVAGSRGNNNNKNDKELLFPCIKCVGTLDAPIESVCEYLADERRVSEYNDLVVDFRGM